MLKSMARRGSLLLLFFVCSCSGGGSEGTGASPNVTVDRDKPINTLNAAERDVVCNEIKARVQEIFGLDRVCESVATEWLDLPEVKPVNLTLSEPALIDSCLAEKQKCIEEETRLNGGPTFCPYEVTCGLEDENFVAGCAAPVRALQACFEESFIALDNQLNLLRCENAFEYLRDLLDFFSTIPVHTAECNEAYEKCPNLRVIAVGACGTYFNAE